MHAFLRVKFFRSQRQIIRSFSQNISNVSTQSRSCDPGRPLASTQVAHLHCTVIVRCNEASQSVRNTFPAFLFQANDNISNRTLTISLLVRLCRAAPPESYWVLSIHVCLHTHRTTNCSASSSCCCCLRVRSKTHQM